MFRCKFRRQSRSRFFFSLHFTRSLIPSYGKFIDFPTRALSLHQMTNEIYIRECKPLLCFGCRPFNLTQFKFIVQISPLRLVDTIIIRHNSTANWNKSYADDLLLKVGISRSMSPYQILLYSQKFFHRLLNFITSWWYNEIYIFPSSL